MELEKQLQPPSPHRGLFAKALSLEPGKQAPAGAIVEEDGIFSIPESLETAGVELDPGFKALVDSVLDAGQS